MTVQCGHNQTFDVLVDTGSGILWVGAENPYVPGLKTVEYVCFIHIIQILGGRNTQTM